MKIQPMYGSELIQDQRLSLPTLIMMNIQKMNWMKSNNLLNLLKTNANPIIEHLKDETCNKMFIIYNVYPQPYSW